MSQCKLCHGRDYHYCTKLDMHVDAAEANSELRRQLGRRGISGKIGGTITGALLGGPVGAIAGLFLGDTLDD